MRLDSSPSLTVSLPLLHTTDTAPSLPEISSAILPVLPPPQYASSIVVEDIFMSQILLIATVTFSSVEVNSPSLAVNDRLSD